MSARNIPELLVKLSLIGMTFTEAVEWGLKIASLIVVIGWTLQQWWWRRSDRKKGTSEKETE